MNDVWSCLCGEGITTHGPNRALASCCQPKGIFNEDDAADWRRRLRGEPIRMIEADPATAVVTVSATSMRVVKLPNPSPTLERDAAAMVGMFLMDIPGLSTVQAVDTAMSIVAALIEHGYIANDAVKDIVDATEDLFNGWGGAAPDVPDVPIDRLELDALWNAWRRL